MKRIFPGLIAIILLAAGSVGGTAPQVTPTNLNKTISAGQGSVFDQIYVANTDAVESVITYTVVTTNTWLGVSPTNGNVQNGSMNTVLVTYAAAGLPPGGHTGRLDIVTAGFGTQSVDVALQVNHQPEAAWDAGSRVWTNEIIAGASLAGTNLVVWNASGVPTGEMSYEIYVLGDAFGWVSVSNASGVSTGNTQTVTVNYATAGLPAGVYTAQLALEGKDTATGRLTTNSPLYLGLKLTVKGSSPVIRSDVTNLSQTVLENLTGTNSFRIWNEGRAPLGSMRYTITPDVGWITVTPAMGTITDAEQAEIKVVWNANAFSVADYPGNLIISAEGATDLMIPLTMTVESRTPVNWELPSIMGAIYIGKTVTADVGLWKNQVRLTFDYQWQWNNNGMASNLTNGAGATYTITTADRGKYLRVKVTATDLNPTPKSASAYSAWADAAKVKAIRADWNGDGLTDLWLYNETSGCWYANFGTTNSAQGIFPGGPGMLAAPGDYDGDGYEDLAVYDPAHGMWHVDFLPRGQYVSGSLFGGTPQEAEATPVSADYDGDGATDVALYYMGYWAIRYSSLQAVSIIPPFAGILAQPVWGDWDGDGTTDLGAYDNGVWTLRLNDGRLMEYTFGGTGAGIMPAPGDYDGDSITDLGVHDANANQWCWRSSSTGLSTNERSFGPRGGVPMQGYYDHDQKEDFAQVIVSADGDVIAWLVKRTMETNFPYRGQSFQQSTERWRVSW